MPGTSLYPCHWSIKYVITLVSISGRFMKVLYHIFVICVIHWVVSATVFLCLLTYFSKAVGLFLLNTKVLRSCVACFFFSPVNISKWFFFKYIPLMGDLYIHFCLVIDEFLVSLPLSTCIIQKSLQIIRKWSLSWDLNVVS